MAPQSARQTMPTHRPPRLFPTGAGPFLAAGSSPSFDFDFGNADAHVARQRAGGFLRIERGSRQRLHGFRLAPHTYPTVTPSRTPTATRTSRRTATRSPTPIPYAHTTHAERRTRTPTPIRRTPARHRATPTRTATVRDQYANEDARHADATPRRGRATTPSPSNTPSRTPTRTPTWPTRDENEHADADPDPADQHSDSDEDATSIPPTNTPHDPYGNAAGCDRHNAPQPQGRPPGRPRISSYPRPPERRCRPGHRTTQAAEQPPRHNKEAIRPPCCFWIVIICRLTRLATEMALVKPRWRPAHATCAPEELALGVPDSDRRLRRGDLVAAQRIPGATHGGEHRRPCRDERGAVLWILRRWGRTCLLGSRQAWSLLGLGQLTAFGVCFLLEYLQALLPALGWLGTAAGILAAVRLCAGRQQSVPVSGSRPP